MANLHELLSIGDLAAQVGLQPATLREWERRHGFPVAERLPSGHRRYAPAVVAEVRSVLDRQRAGLSLAAAIAAVVDAGEAATGWSAYAEIEAASRRAPTHLSRRAMLAFSRAIEDASAASGRSGVVVGCFQRESVYRACEPRWLALARSAQACVAFADFAELGGPPSVVEVPIEPASPLHREWSVAVANTKLAACVAGWEWPGGGAFEALWSIEPEVVHRVIERALSAARLVAGDRVPLGIGLAAPPSDLGAAMSLLDRVIERLDR
jgi:DNA-binding transcriptional MerR regulator